MPPRVNLPNALRQLESFSVVQLALYPAKKYLHVMVRHLVQKSKMRWAARDIRRFTCLAEWRLHLWCGYRTPLWRVFSAPPN